LNLKKALRKPNSPVKKGKEAEDPLMLLAKDMEAKLKAISKDRAE
jgi:hypothetical protein